ncbi:hypothetical protein EJ06DRAFT_14078 [Trichodelitschia bisporula]|uniref:Uncharacterized protein n=1 Tax=Trichodelitschia bisporula TaxID=703511 RepID=A0A6G1IA03_9PEZI|nr:hypothetical protein EJ06DRAFT_14078 [Trichodelitschia bisporula]
MRRGWRFSHASFPLHLSLSIAPLAHLHRPLKSALLSCQSSQFDSRLSYSPPTTARLSAVSRRESTIERRDGKVLVTTRPRPPTLSSKSPNLKAPPPFVRYLLETQHPRPAPFVAPSTPWELQIRGRAAPPPPLPSTIFNYFFLGSTLSALPSTGLPASRFPLLDSRIPRPPRTCQHP